MTSKERLGLAIKGGEIAFSALHLHSVASKASAKMIVMDLVKLVRELDGKVESLEGEK